MIRILTLVSLLVLPALATAEIYDGLSHGAPAAGSAPAKRMPEPDGPAGEGVVKSVVNGAGYSYVELEHNGKTFWVAGTQVNVAKGDKVSFVENVVMEKFYSKTLKREFDRIIFASHLKKN